MYLPVEKANLILQMLLEGNSVPSVSRITGAHIGARSSDVGQGWRKMRAHHGPEKIRNVEVRDVECDELWILYRQKTEATHARR